MIKLNLAVSRHTVRIGAKRFEQSAEKRFPRGLDRAVP
jgi:hypothetical protein